jgi:hypothetical protein
MSGNGDEPGYDPSAALRALADAPRVGFEAAAAVVERILTLGRPGVAPLPVIPWDGESAPPTEPPPGERRVQLRRARADAERVLDAYGDWARQLLDAVFGLAEGDAPADVVVLGPVAPGGRDDAELWLHAPPGRLTGPAELRVTALTAHDGAVVPAEALRFDPPVLRPAATANGADPGPATLLHLTVPEGTPAGAYHGHVLVTGLPEVALPVRVEVTPP